ncbi:Protein Dok-7 [Triplophysa tibetana]|uniref:Protein Dok-7 n=1 Tax=Triplophysa tibetana TaxID=1572043 RepID=A0A5A9PPF3_9TELE|nr:Protein Dok-7 [Triplophysa tibetana]
MSGTMQRLILSDLTILFVHRPTDLSLTSDICGPSLVSYACLSYFESDPRGHAYSCHAGKMCDIVIAEGAGKIRDGKKVRKRSACAREWKSRWLVLRKPSPVADCLVLYVYKERGLKERYSLTLEHICGLEAHVGGDGVSFTLSILSITRTAVLGFDSREALNSWDLQIRYCLGEVHSFNVSVLPHTKLECGPATLHLCNDLLVIAKNQPPVITGHWNLLELRRYGPVSSGFVFEGGTRCGSWTGVFLLACSEGEQISFLFDCIVRGISPSRGPFGLRPVLPVCDNSAVSVQDRLNHDAEELERRLSLLSHSTASSVGSSMMGDAGSISGSSDTSQWECNISSRPALWTESVLPITSETSHPLPPSTASQGDDKPSESLNHELSVPVDPVHPRNLKDTGRQNSSDSGIATGSQSSYTGSLSSYIGSLDAAAPGDEYGMLLNLPAPAYLEKHLCTCPPRRAQEYQVPSSLRYLYDTPRRLLETTRTSDSSGVRSRSTEGSALSDSGQTELSISCQTKDCSECPRQSDSGPALIHYHRTEGTLEIDRGEGLKKEEGPKGSSCSKKCGDYTNRSHPAAGHKSLFTTCPSCGGLKGTRLPGMISLPLMPGKKKAPATTDVTAQPTNQESEDIRKPCASWTIHNSWKTSSERPQSNEERRSDGIVSCPSDLLAHYSPADRHSVNGSVYEPMSSSLVPVGFESKRPAHSAHALLYENCLNCRRGENKCHLPKPTPPTRHQECFQQDQSIVLRRSHSNISESICFSTEDLNISRQTYEEGRSSSKYAQIDITATEAAHRAGTQHRMGREEGLQRLEQRRRGGRLSDVIRPQTRGENAVTHNSST